MQRILLKALKSPPKPMQQITIAHTQIHPHKPYLKKAVRTTTFGISPQNKPQKSNQQQTCRLFLFLVFWPRTIPMTF